MAEASTGTGGTRDRFTGSGELIGQRADAPRRDDGSSADREGRDHDR